MKTLLNNLWAPLFLGLSRVPWLGRVSEYLPCCFLKGETMRTSVALCVALLLTTSILAQAQDQSVTVGPWTIATSSKAEKFDSCTLSRPTNDLDVSFGGYMPETALQLVADYSSILAGPRGPNASIGAHNESSRDCHPDERSCGDYDRAC